MPMRKMLGIKLRYRYSQEIKSSEWQLGLGPCGEIVHELWGGYEEGHFIIRQWTNKSIKEFVFKESDIVGPVTMNLEVWNATPANR